MKNGLSEIIASDEIVEATPKTSATLPTITLRFVTLLAGIVAFFTWAWSR